MDTLYVFRKDTVHHRDTLVWKDSAGFDTISVDLFTLYMKYTWRRSFYPDRWDETRKAEFGLSEAGKARLKNLDHLVISGDSLNPPIIRYAKIPKDFYAQVRIDTFFTWTGNQCTTWVADTVTAKPDSVKCWQKDFVPDSSGALATSSYTGRYWPYHPNPKDSVAKGYWRWGYRYFMVPDSIEPGRIIIPDIRYIHGKGFEVSETISSWMSLDFGLVGRVYIRIQR